MRNSGMKRTGMAALSALAAAGMLLAGSVAALAAPTKPAPPVKPAPVVQKPVVAPARPVQPVRPPQQPVRPSLPPVRQPEPARPTPPNRQPEQVRPVQPVRPIQPVRPEQPVVRQPLVRQPVVRQPVVSRDGRPNVPKEATRIPRAGGGETIKTHDGREMQTDGKGKLALVKTPDGTVAHFNGGHLSTMHKVGPDGSITDVHRSPTGVTTIKKVTPDPYAPGHSVRTIVEGHHAYRERDLLRRPGYRQRTYYANGRTSVAIYHDQPYGRYGVYPVYVPAYTYSPGYYAWFGNSWGSVSFGWGASANYAVYGGYFAPPPAYATPNAWLADYTINQNLQQTTESQQAAQPDATGDPGVEPTDPGESVPAQPQPIPQRVRDVYVQQVQATVQQEQAEAGGQAAPQTVPGALSPDHKIFQSYSDVEATDPNGAECALTGGDFVQREEDTPDAAKTVAVTVVAIARPSSAHCAMNVTLRLAVDTLQDWYNSYLEQQAAGLQAMKDAAGKNGIPAAPNAGQSPNAAGQGTPDDSGALASAVQQQQTDASAMQAQVSGGGQ